MPILPKCLPQWCNLNITFRFLLRMNFRQTVTTNIGIWCDRKGPVNSVINLLGCPNGWVCVCMCVYMRVCVGALFGYCWAFEGYTIPINSFTLIREVTTIKKIVEKTWDDDEKNPLLYSTYIASETESNCGIGDCWRKGW